MDRLSQCTAIFALLFTLLQCSGVHAQAGDGGGADGYSNSELGAAGTGNSGSANSSANLSKGAIIAIAVVVVVVVIAGGEHNDLPFSFLQYTNSPPVTLSVLYFVAKKRQWEVRKSIRRTASRVSTAVKAMTPRTPARMSFSPRSPRFAAAQNDARPFKRKPTQMKQTKIAPDLEKGFPSIDQTLQQRSSEESHDSKIDNPARPLHVKKDSMNGRQKAVQKPKPILTVPPSEFDIDSPKSPMWQRIFGRA